MKSKNIEIKEWDIFKNLPVKTGITTRCNGVSSHPYTSLNLATHTGDNISDVKTNRKKLCDLLNVPYKNYTYGTQIHGDTIHKVTRTNYEVNNIECDALLLNNNKALINIFVADCVPIVIYDKAKNIGGLCHCGWKGTAKQLLKKMILELKNCYNSNSKEILIGIGPSIGACCYNVSEDLFNSFNPNKEEGYKRESKFYLNLKEINKNQAIKEGIPIENIEVMNICTSCCNDSFYSFRKEGESSGRFSCFLKLIS